MSRTFQRPVEYDPQLAQRAQALAASSPAADKKQLKDELGFDSDVEISEDEESQDLDASGSPINDKAAKARQHEEELERALAAVRVAQENRAKAEAHSKALEERLEEFQRLSNQAQAILVNRFKQQISNLQETIDEQAEALKDRGAPLDLQEEKLEEKPESGLTVEMRKENRELKLLNKELKNSLEELKKRGEQREKQENQEKEEKSAKEAKKQENQQNQWKQEIQEKIDKIQQLEGKIRQLEEKIAQQEIAVKREKTEKPVEEKTGEIPLKQYETLQENHKILQERLAAVHQQVNQWVLEEKSSDGPPSSGPSLVFSDENSLRQFYDLFLGLKKKFQSLEEIHRLSQESRDSQKKEILEAGEREILSLKENLENSNKEKEKILEEKQEEILLLKQSIKEINDLMEETQQEINSVKDKAKEKLTVASETIKKLKAEYSQLKTQFLAQKSSGAQQKAAMVEISGKIQLFQSTLHHLRAEAGQLSLNSLEPMLNKEIAQFFQRHQAEKAALLQSYKKEFQARKLLLNQIQELKGNIRVFCRVRPLSDKEKGEAANCIEFLEENTLQIVNTEKKTNNSFEFDRIFTPTSTQTGVFEEISDLIVSVLDGYNCCIFAYGQTGTGKTHTMQGPPEDPGVNLRTLDKLFSVISEREAEMSYAIKISLLEIYNEKIQDLLNSEVRAPLKVVAGPNGMEVPELITNVVTNSQQVLETLKAGQKNRKVVATAMNDASSRSHLVLSVYVSGKNKFSNKETLSRLHLVDLAGSERVSRSGVTGDAMKEAQAINSSLSALGNVIAARANKAAHVPYRDSQLTYLLQDSLEKNSKTLMFVQISPSAADAGESICSLRFAERVRKVELGKAQVNRRNSKS